MVQGCYLETERDEGGFEKARCPLCGGENVLHMFINIVGDERVEEIILIRK
jgi:hypothetical protein